MGYSVNLTLRLLCLVNDPRGRTRNTLWINYSDVLHRNAYIMHKAGFVRYMRYNDKKIT